MKLKPKQAIAKHFGNIKDPRIEHSKDYRLIGTLSMAILAVICGANGSVGIQTYGNAKQALVPHYGKNDAPLIPGFWRSPLKMAEIFPCRGFWADCPMRPNQCLDPKGLVT